MKKDYQAFVSAHERAQKTIAGFNGQDSMYDATASVKFGFGFYVFEEDTRLIGRFAQEVDIFSLIYEVNPDVFN